MNKKSLFVIMSALIVSCIFFSCDSLWNVQENNTTSISLNIPLQSLVKNSNSKAHTVRPINGNDSETLEAIVSVYNANTDKVIKSVEETINDDLESIEVTIDGLKIGQKVYASIEITHNPRTLLNTDNQQNIYSGELDNTYFKSISESTTLKKGDNILMTRPQAVFVLPEAGSDEMYSPAIEYENEGNNDNTGYTPASPLLTIEEAYKVLKHNRESLPKDATVYIMDTLYYEYDTDTDTAPSTILDYPGLTLKRFASRGRDERGTNGLIHISGATLTLQEVTIDGNNKAYTANTPLVSVRSSADAESHLILDTGSVLENSRVESVDSYVSVYSAISITGGTLTLKGGTISNNEGIAAVGIDENEGGTIELESGLIHIRGNTYNGAPSDVALLASPYPGAGGYYGTHLRLTGNVDTRSRIGIHTFANTGEGPGPAIPQDESLLVLTENSTINRDNFVLNNAGTTMLSADKTQLQYKKPENLQFIDLTNNQTVQITDEHEITFTNYEIPYYNAPSIVVSNGAARASFIEGIYNNLQQHVWNLPEGVKSIEVNYSSPTQMPYENFTFTFIAKEGYYFNERGTITPTYTSFGTINIYENTYYVHEVAEEYTADGTKEKPFGRVQQAINQIYAANDGKTEFTIRVTGTIVGHNTSDDNVFGDYGDATDEALMEIESNSDIPLNIHIEGYSRDGKIGGALNSALSYSNGTVLLIEGNASDKSLVNITLGEELTVTGASGDKHAVNVTNAILTLDGVAITENSITGSTEPISLTNSRLNLQGGTNITNNGDLTSRSWVNITDDSTDKIYFTGLFTGTIDQGDMGITYYNGTTNENFESNIIKLLELKPDWTRQEEVSNVSVLIGPR